MKKNNVLLALLVSPLLVVSCTNNEILEVGNQFVDSTNIEMEESFATTSIDLSSYIITKGVLSGISDEAIVNGKLVIPSNVTLIARDDLGKSVSIFTEKQKQLLRELVVGDYQKGNQVTIDAYSLDGCLNLNKITFGPKTKEVSGFIINEKFNINTVVWKKTTTEGFDLLSFPFGLDVKNYELNGSIISNTKKINLIIPTGASLNFVDWVGNFKSIKEIK